MASLEARAEDSRKYTKQLEHWSQVVADLKSADVTEEVARDIELIRTWIGQAQAFLASEKFEKIDRLLKRIEAQAIFCRAKINRLEAEQQADQAEEQAAALEKKAAEIRARADAAEKKMRQLESQGL